jgi:hypothetical protein
MCHWHAKGNCSNGKTCRFAHDMKELRGTHGEQQGKVSKVVSKAGKAKNKTNDELLRQGANRMVEAHKVDEENLAPAAEEVQNMLNPSIFIQPGADLVNADYASAWDPVKVYSKLSTEVNFLDSLYFPRGFQLSNDSMDFNIIPETPSCEQADEGISSLVTKVRDLSEEVRTLQLQVAQQHRTGSSLSKSTKSGSADLHSSDDSSSACTPRTTLQKLSQLRAFSRDLQSAFDLNMKSAVTT